MITAGLGGLCIAAMSACGFTGYGYFQQRRIAETEKASVEKTEHANQDLQDAIYRLAGQFNSKAIGDINEVQIGINMIGDQLVGQLERQRNESRTQLAQLVAWHHQLQREYAYTESLVYSGDPDKVQSGIERWLTQAHYPEGMKGALLDRIEIESGFNPQAVSESGYKCLIQWDSTRYRNLLRFARYTPTRGNPCPRWDYQIAFMDHELRHVPSYRGAWRGTYHSVTSIYFGGVE